MDQVGECYAESDLRGNIVFVNKTYCNTFGIAPEAREGHNYKALFTAEMAAHFREAYARVYQTGEAVKLEYSLTLQNGKHVFNEQSISLKRDAQGNPAGFMVIVRDCFERKQNEIELVRAKKAAEAASSAKGQFLANMSHEIRTPLNGVLGMLELLASTNPTREQKELLEMAQGAAQSLLGVVNDVLDFSKIEAGKLELDCLEFDPAELARRAMDVIKVQAAKNGLAVGCEVSPDVPGSVLGDPVRLQQVLLNLLGNAVKFTAAGRVQLNVRVEGVREGKVELGFSVIDSGIGISPEKQEAIFEAFTQADASTTRKFGGTGLGLAICSRIVQCMGGKIAVKSQLGQGSTFSFTISARIVDKGVAKTAPPIMVHNGPERSLRILMAEDNAVNQKLAVRLLERLGHQVQVAGNGIEALQRYNNDSFDLVFMDVQMPEMDGFTATAEIRAAERSTGQRIPIIAMTAHAMKGDRERCLQAGMDDYISKPISGEAVRAAISRLHQV